LYFLDLRIGRAPSSFAGHGGDEYSWGW